MTFIYMTMQLMPPIILAKPFLYQMSTNPSPYFQLGVIDTPPSL